MELLPHGEREIEVIYDQDWITKRPDRLQLFLVKYERVHIGLSSWVQKELL